MTEPARLSSETQSMVTEELTGNLHELLLAVKELKALTLEIAKIFRDIDDRLKLANGTAEIGQERMEIPFPGQIQRELILDVDEG